MSEFYAHYPHLLRPPPASRSSSSTSTQTSHPQPKPRVPSQLGMSQTPSASASSLGLGGKLMSMLDRQKFALFQVDVTLHELGNVPQLEGEFAVRWRFRGKRPKARDAVHRLHGHPHIHGSSTPGAGPSVAPSPKPSLPNLKITQPAYAGSLHPSSSSLSLRSNSTGGSSSIRSGHGLPHPPPGHTPAPALKGKSLSTPPLPMTGINGGGSGNGKHGRVEKKGTDPTPLRQSVAVGPELETVESPSPLDTASSSHLPSPVDHGSHTPTPGGSRLPSRSSTLPPTHPLSTASMSSARSSSAHLGVSTGPSSASSSTSHLSAPTPAPGGRGSSATPVQLERTGSHMTTSALSAHSGSTSSQAGADQAALGVRGGDRPAPRRVRSISGASLHGVPPPSGPGKGRSLPLSARRGVTSGRPLKSHTCTWDHDLQLALRIPISKDRSGTPTPGSKSRAPLLGEGSESASGLQLVIEQLPTASSTSPAHAKSSEPSPHESGEKHTGRHNHSRGQGHSPTSAPKGERTVFGKVDIDLAAFAGRGKTTRKFLLVGSRTNATVKLTVDMSWIGGEGSWVAPPLQEGHHVTNQMKDVMGGRDANQDLERDLALVKTPSASSGESSVSRSQSTKSRNASSLNLTRAPSATISQPRPQYKTYDQHLLSPDSAAHRAALPRSDKADVSTSAGKGKEQPGVNGKDKEPSANSGSPTRFLFPLHRPQHHHHRHSQHSNRVRHTHGVTELSPEAVIEHIFNPYESHEESPFTFVPPPRPTSVNLPSPLREDEEHHEHAPLSEPEHLEHRQHRLAGWRKRRDQRKELAAGKTTMGIGAGLSQAHLAYSMSHQGGEPSRRMGGTATPVPAQ